MDSFVSFDRLAKLGNDDLKSFCFNKGLLTGGNKSQLAERLFGVLMCKELSNGQLGVLLQNEGKPYTGTKEVLVTRLTASAQPPTASVQGSLAPSAFAPAKQLTVPSAATTAPAARLAAASIQETSASSAATSAPAARLVFSSAQGSAAFPAGAYAPAARLLTLSGPSILGTLAFPTATSAPAASSSHSSSLSAAASAPAARLAVPSTLGSSFSAAASSAPAVQLVASALPAAASAPSSAPASAAGVSDADVLMALDARRNNGKKTTVPSLVFELTDANGPQGAVQAAVDRLLKNRVVEPWTGTTRGLPEYRRLGDQAQRNRPPLGGNLRGGLPESGAGTSSPSAPQAGAKRKAGDGDDDRDDAEDAHDTLYHFYHGVEVNAAVHNARFSARVRDLSGKAHFESGHIECINLAPVYLGDLFHVPHTITSGKMHEVITEAAASWSESTYNSHPLKPYFHKRESGVGYVLKPYFSCSVDHLIPQNMGGIDHPRNYAFMSSSLNSAFSDRLDEKFSVMGPSVRRRVYMFARAARNALARELNAWLKDLPRETGAVVIE